MALPEPTPTLTPDIDATVEARLAPMLAVAPTATILPTASSAPSPTPSPSPTPAPQPTAKPTEAASPIPQPENLLSEMVERVRTSVVRIESLAMTGSGVIFDTSAESAFIVTNYHVVEGVAHVDVLVDECPVT